MKENTIYPTDIRALPGPVRRYCRLCGYTSTAQPTQCRIIWSDVKMRFSPTGRWKKIYCDEYLSADGPARIANMRTKGILPITAKDQYQQGHGSMLIKLAGLISLQNAKGREMDQSGLVTILSECLLFPSFLLQPYIQWTAIDHYQAGATIRVNETSASGRFYFNNAGEFTSFESTDRWQALKDGSFARTPWKVTASDYVEDAGVRRPSLTTASWLNNGQWWEYFKGSIVAIR